MNREEARILLGKIEKLVLCPNRFEELLKKKVLPERLRAAKRAALAAETVKTERVRTGKYTSKGEIIRRRPIINPKSLAYELGKLLYILHEVGGIWIEPPEAWDISYSTAMRDNTARVMSDTAEGRPSVVDISGAEKQSIRYEDGDILVRIFDTEGRGLAYAVHLLMRQAEATGVFRCPGCDEMSFVYNNQKRSACDAKCRKRIERKKKAEKERAAALKRRQQALVDEQERSILDYKIKKILDAERRIYSLTAVLIGIT